MSTFETEIPVKQTAVPTVKVGQLLEYASKADPNIKQVVLSYDDKEGRPTTNDDIW